MALFADSTPKVVPEFYHFWVVNFTKIWNRKFTDYTRVAAELSCTCFGTTGLRIPGLGCQAPSSEWTAPWEPLWYKSGPLCQCHSVYRHPQKRDSGIGRPAHTSTGCRLLFLNVCKWCAEVCLRQAAGTFFSI